MSGGYHIGDQSAPHFLTFQVVNWVDVFTRQSYRDIVVDSFIHCQREKDLVVHAWVIMSNHVHCILSSRSGKLSDTIRDLKRHTSKAILKEIHDGSESRREWMLQQFRFAAGQHQRNEAFQVWTHENHPIELDGALTDQRVDYIHNNPVVAGLVEEPEHYLYSSARDYAEGKGLIPIEPLW